MLFAQDIPKDWLDRLFEAGPLAAIAFGLAALIFAIAWLVWKFGPKIVKSHIDFVESAQVCNEENTEINKKLSAPLAPAGDPRFDGHNFSTVHTNKALEYLARAMQELSVGHPQEKAALPLIQAAVQTLRKSARDQHGPDIFPTRNTA